MKTNKVFRKTLSLLLALVMTVSLLPAAAFADETEAEETSPAVAETVTDGASDAALQKEAEDGVRLPLPSGGGRFIIDLPLIPTVPEIPEEVRELAGQYNLGGRGLKAAKSYTVTLDCCGGATSEGDASFTVAAYYNQFLPNVEVPVCAGMSFQGFFDGEDGTGEMYYDADGNSVTRWTQTQGGTLYAYWLPASYIITLNGGEFAPTYASEVSVYYGDELQIPTLPFSEGHTFLGFFDAEEGGQQYVDGDGNCVRTWDKEESATLYAHWDTPVVTYTMTLDPNNGEPCTEIELEANGSLPEKVEVPKRYGYTFSGYVLLNEDGTMSFRIYYNSKGDRYTYLYAGVKTSYEWDGCSNIRLFATWMVSLISVHLELNTPEGLTGGYTSDSGFLINPDKVYTTVGNMMPSLTCMPTCQFHEFLGYFSEAEGGYQYYAADGTPIRKMDLSDEDPVLYAHWRPVAYQFKLDYNGGSYAGSNRTQYVALYYGQPASGTDVIPTRTGFTFSGYYTVKPTNTLSDFPYQLIDSEGDSLTYRTVDSSLLTASNRTLYAGWIPVVYSIDYLDAGGGDYSGSIPSGWVSSFQYNNEVVLPTPSREGVTFLGWYLESDCSGAKITKIKSYTYSEDLVLYALWSDSPYAEGATRGGGKRFLAPSPAPKGNDPLNPQEPQKTETKVVLYANGGKFGSGNTSEIKATFGEPMPALTQLPTRSDYAFVGFYDAKNGGNQYYGANGNSVAVWDKTAKSATLYAHWVSERVEVTLNANGGTIPAGGVSKITAVYGQPMPSLGALPTRDGYVFLGYYADNTANSVQYYRANGASARNWDNGPTTLTAHWAEAELRGTVTWKNYDGTVLETDTGVVAGTVPVYNGAVPTRTPDGLYTYVFSGWTPAVTEFGGDITYTANFTRAESLYNVTWTDEDGTELGTSQVAAGTLPVYNGELPQKEGNAQYTYTFAGWSPELVPAISDATYAATYTATVNEYTVTWMNDDGNVIKTDAVPYGEKPVYGESLPVSTVNGNFTFIGWESSEYAPEYDENGQLIRIPVGQSELAAYKPVAVTADVTYTAKYALDECLNFTAVGGDVTIGMNLVGFKESVAAGMSPYKVLYRFADSAEWIETDLQSDPLVIPEGETVYLRTSKIFTEICAGSGFRAFRCFTMNNGGGNGTIEANGSVMSLISVLADPTQELTKGEFAGLFYNCAVLTKAPELPTAPIASGSTDVYARMFHGCSGLTEAPVIPVCGAVAYNYYMMFAGCTNLNDVTVEFTDWNFNGGFNVTTRWLENVAESGTFHCPVSLDMSVRDTSHVPEGWVIDAGPCTVIWQDEDGNVLCTQDDYCAGDMPVYPDGEPTKDMDERYEYTFDGWEPELAPLTAEETVYTAKFAKTDRLYTVIWMDSYSVPVTPLMNSSGQVEFYRNQFKYGEPTVYGGEAPTRESTERADYVFAGWSPEMAETVTCDTTYYAIFDEVLKEYTITWQDEDGTVLETQKLHYYDIPKYSGATPTKPSTEDYNYAFTGWSPAVKRVTEDATYTATYEETERLYSVTWVDGNNNVLATDYYHYGETPVYNGATPTKQSTAQYQYTFKGVWLTPSVQIGHTDDGYPIMSWPETIGPVTKDVIYVAQFDSTVRKYTVIWKDEAATGGSSFVGGIPGGGNYMKTFYSAEFEYGATPVYGGETPTKASDAHYDYVFDGWTPEMTTVTGAAIYTATYRAIPHTFYTVTWEDIDGTVLATTTVGYGEMPVYDGETPTKASTAQYEYTFNGWTPELQAVTGDVTYAATYSAAVRCYEVEWKDGNDMLIYKESLPYGETPVFDEQQLNSVRKKATNAEQYTFNGHWSPEIGPVTGDVCYVPQFDTEPRALWYMWVYCQDGLNIFNSQNWCIYEQKYGVYGDEFVYEGETPTRGADDMYTYTFAGWSEPVLTGRWPDLESYVYYAQFDTTLRKYTVTWLDEPLTGDDHAETLYTADFEYGTMPVYGGETPTKASDAHYDYVFDGWSSEMTTVTGNATYTATYRAVPHTHTVTWKDIDGTVLATTTVAYGEMPVYSGSTPTKAPAEQYEYTFNGWTPELKTVTGDATYTATYSASVRKFEVRWVNGNGQLIYSESVSYGETPVFDEQYEERASKYRTQSETYIFNGQWLPTPAPVTESVTYAAQFNSKPTEMLYNWVCPDGKGGTIRLAFKFGVYGDEFVYEGETPTLPDSDECRYVFVGWSEPVWTSAQLYLDVYELTALFEERPLEPDYLSFTARDTDMQIYMDISGTFTGVEIKPQLKYRIGKTGTWQDFEGKKTLVEVPQNETVYFGTDVSRTNLSKDMQWTFYSMGDGTFEAGGSVMSLLDPDADPNATMDTGAFRGLFAWDGNYGMKITTAPDLPATNLSVSCYDSMFLGNKTLTSTANMGDGENGVQLAAAACYSMYQNCINLEETTSTLPQVTSSDATSCYAHMFDGCSNLRHPSDLSGSTVVPSSAFASMYKNCYALEEIPNLPANATSVGEHAFTGMFYGCTSLTDKLLDSTKPFAMPSVTTGKEAYMEMFEGCTSLKIVPNLPAQTLSEGCYQMMFADCRALNDVSACNISGVRTMAKNCFRFMFAGCASLTTAPALPNVALAEGCYAYMFEGCTALTSAPWLPATELAPSCYEGMFESCTSLRYAPAAELSELPASYVPRTVAEYTQDSSGVGISNENAGAAEGIQVSGISRPGAHFKQVTDLCYNGRYYPYLPAMTMEDSCYAYMFKGCTALEIAPELPAMSLAKSCYRGMFDGCTKLYGVPRLPAYAVYDRSYEEMFKGCTALWKAPELPARYVANYCYQSMFSGCTALTNAPEIVAASGTDTSYAYNKMFYGCSKLNNLTVRFLTWPKNGNGTQNWLSGVATAGTFNCYVDLDTSKTGASGVPSKWIPNILTDDYLGFTAVGGDVKISMARGNTGTAPTLKYRLSTETDWHDFSSAAGTTVTVPSGKTVYFGTDVAYTSLNNDNFVMTRVDPNSNATVEASGSVTSLLDPTREHGHTVGELQNLFMNCTILTVAPELPAVNITNSKGYTAMFRGCTALREAPELPAYNVDTACYGFMFYDCTSLKEAPVLHLRNVTNGSYLRMFRNCTALESAEIYAESVDGACFSEMFAGCSSFKELTMTFTDTSILSNSKALSGFVDGVAANGTFYYSWKLQKALSELGGNDAKTSLGLPSAWTAVAQ